MHTGACNRKSCYAPLELALAAGPDALDDINHDHNHIQLQRSTLVLEGLPCLRLVLYSFACMHRLDGCCAN